MVAILHTGSASRGAMHQAALALMLPPSAAARVQALRREYGISAPPHGVVQPHVTVVFLGGPLSTAQVAAAATLLDGLPGDPIRVHIGGLGWFTAGGRVVNLHLRVVEAGALRSLHLAALDRLASAGRPSPSAHVAGRYVPHVSIYDAIDIAEADLPAGPPPADEAVVLSDLALMVRALDGLGDEVRRTGEPA